MPYKIVQEYSFDKFKKDLFPIHTTTEEKCLQHKLAWDKWKKSPEKHKRDIGIIKDENPTVYIARIALNELFSDLEIYIHHNPCFMGFGNERDDTYLIMEKEDYNLSEEDEGIGDGSSITLPFWKALIRDEITKRIDFEKSYFGYIDFA